MPFLLSIDPERQLIRVTVGGTITDEDMLEFVKQLRATSAHRSRYKIFYDCTGISALQITGNGIYALGLLTENDVNRVALVADHPFVYGMAKIYESIANWNTEPFRCSKTRPPP